MSLGEEWRATAHRLATRLYPPSRSTTWLSWIGPERIGIGNLPTARSLADLPGAGVTHVVNCRFRAQTWFSQDLAMERVVFGAPRVMHAPMWDNGRPKDPARFAAAALFAADALADPDNRVFIHCQQGRRRSVLVAYAVLRLRGHSAHDAARLIAEYRREAELVPAYLASVEAWLKQR
jgi:hypothetical protein